MTAYENLVTQKEKTDLVHQVVTIHGKNAKDQQVKETLCFPDFHYKGFNDEEKELNTFNLLTGENIVAMQFCIQGGCTYKSNQQKKAVIIKNSEHNILFIAKGELNFTLTGNGFRFINILIREDFFLQYLPNEYIFNKADSVAKMFTKNLFISPKLRNVLNEIDTCEFAGHLRSLYIKAKIIELLTLQLAQYEEEKSTPSLLKPIEIEKMILVKEMIENNLYEPHTITSLARAVGTNEQYLKTHFKILFGSTVFGHILSCKMQKAKEMLLTGKHQITEIAEIVGYKHATHFTSAFKKFFGYLPQTLKITKIFFGTYFSVTFELEGIVPLLHC